MFSFPLVFAIINKRKPTKYLFTTNSLAENIFICLQNKFHFKLKQMIPTWVPAAAVMNVIEYLNVKITLYYNIS